MGIIMKDVYESPLNSRYASKEMKYLFSPDYKFKTWRRLWIALAESEKELGLNITDEQIAELKAHADDINYDVAEAREKKFATTYVARLRLRRSVPQGGGNNSPRRNLLLCR